MNFKQISILITLAIFICIQQLKAQGESTLKLDELKGYKELKIGFDIQELVKSLKLKEEDYFDEGFEITYKRYYFKNLAASGYGEIFQCKVKEIRLDEKNGLVSKIYIEFREMKDFQKLISGFADYLETQLPCSIAVMDDSYGGCFLTGNEIDFSVQNIDTPLAVIFLKIGE